MSEEYDYMMSGGGLGSGQFWGNLAKANERIVELEAQVERLRQAAREGSGTIIKALADLVRMAQPEGVSVRGNGGRELIDREMVVDRALAIRKSLDLLNATLAATEPKP